MTPSLYTHIPFCRQRCSYCDFFSSVDYTKEAQLTYVEALIESLKRGAAEQTIHSFKTLYIGGGTPTELSSLALKRLLSGLSPYLKGGEEFTIEVNPETVTEELLDLLASGGVNRISLGIQSFSEAVRDSLGRVGSDRSIEKALKLIRKRWDGALSVDLITGVAGQSVSGQRGEIERAFYEGAEHLSCYTLTIGKESRLFRKVREGRYTPLHWQQEEALWESVLETTERLGLKQYEVSNFSLAQRECQHNMRYWHMRPWLGIGSSAVSFLSDEKGLYRAKWESNVPPQRESIERISPTEALFETYMMGLRAVQGIEKESFSALWKHPPEFFIPLTLSTPDGQRFLENSRLSLKATPYGLARLNRILIQISGEIEALSPPPVADISRWREL